MNEITSHARQMLTPKEEQMVRLHDWADVELVVNRNGNGDWKENEFVILKRNRCHGLGWGHDKTYITL